MESLFRRRIVATLSTILACVLLVATPVVAAERYQGADVSRVLDRDTQMQICDNESDGHRAYTRFDRSFDNRGNLVLVDGSAGGTCTNDFSGNRVVQHMTCEVRGGSIGGGDDVCTDYSYHI